MEFGTVFYKKITNLRLLLKTFKNSEKSNCSRLIF